MDRRVKERLVGASILVVLVVLIVPELLSGPPAPAPSRAGAGLPVSAPEYVVFQNQDGPITQCPFCQGPLKYPVTAWLSSIKIWNKK